MFTSRILPLSAIALSLACAFAAHAEAQATYPNAVDFERNNSAFISRIHADYAYLRGITGKGVTVAILDTGISAGHREFSEAGKLLAGFNALDGSADVTDRAGHGSHVAGIIAASRDGRGMFGVAYGATLLPVKVFPDGGGGSTAGLDAGLRHAIGKAPIVNMSVGAGGSYDPRVMQEAVRAGVLIVASAGNDGAANPGWPARFAKEAWANNQIIAVGAVDSATRIAAFSNRAGDTAAWFLVAPGIGIYSTYRNDQYATMSGTSMAAPVVSGAAALVKQLWPSLRAEQIATILFVTATDLGAPGIDPVYGRGLLNVEKALQPIGTLTTTSYNGKTINVLAGSTQPSAATSTLWSMAASGQLRVVGLDDFQRDFGVDLGATVARPPSMSLEQALGRMDNRLEVVEQVIGDDVDAAFAYERSSAHARLAGFSLRARSDGTEAAFGAGGQADSYFGAGGLKLAPELSLAQVGALANPYFTLVPSASHLALAREAGGLKLKVGVLSSGLNRTLASQDGVIPSSTLLLPQASAGLFEVSKSFDGGAVSLSVSQTREANAWLGSWSTGALSLGSRASTSTVQLAGALMLAPKLALAGQAAYGVTPGGAGRDGLITEVTTARTNAFALALVAADRVRPGDRLSFSLSQPMRAYSGRIVMDVLSNAQTRERLVFSMVPVGREMRAELNYLAPLDRMSSFGLSLTVRRDPNNMIDIEMEKLLVLRYARQF
jgi:hypothetical protein